MNWRDTIILGMASLLIGSVAALATSRISPTPHIASSAVCGYSLDSVTQVRIPLRGCVAPSYGWPLPYLHSQALVFLQNFHTNIPQNPANAFGISADTHLDYLELAGDWVLFAVAGALILIVAYKLAKPAKAARKR
jgi:hypothetical protein